MRRSSRTQEYMVSAAAEYIPYLFLAESKTCSETAMQTDNPIREVLVMQGIILSLTDLNRGCIAFLLNVIIFTSDGYWTVPLRAFTNDVYTHVFRSCSNSR